MQSVRHLIAAAAMVGAAIFAATGAQAQSREFTAVLAGGNEVSPGGVANAGDPDAFGIASVLIATPGSICFSILLQNADPATAAHIHNAPAGVNGGIALALAVNGKSPFRIAQCLAVAPATVAAIQANPHLFYVNIHNGAFPSGAARGQLQ